MGDDERRRHTLIASRMYARGEAAIGGLLLSAKRLKVEVASQSVG